jgi:hypothetical protein
MKRIITIVLLINLFLSGYGQQNDRERKKREFDITNQFEMDWYYFRMLKNSEIPDTVKYIDRSRANPYRMFQPEKMRYSGGAYYYWPDIKISDWGKSKGDKPNEYVDLRSSNFYLVEKKDGLLSINKNILTEEVLDSIRLNIYDSIFPYDNRFLVVNKRKNVIVDGSDYTFHSGNVEWGEWRDVGFWRAVDHCGYIRGVQFGIENVIKFRQEFSDKIRAFRPDFPNYVYTENRDISLLTNGFVIIGAPKGKEDQLVEYIYYSNLPEKTGDSDETHYYEMRYILPTRIKSIKERRLEKRPLTNEEQKYILNWENKMIMFLDGKESILLRGMKEIEIKDEE